MQKKFFLKQLKKELIFYKVRIKMKYHIIVMLFKYLISKIKYIVYFLSVNYIPKNQIIFKEIKFKTSESEIEMFLEIINHSRTFFYPLTNMIYILIIWYFVDRFNTYIFIYLFYRKIKISQ